MAITNSLLICTRSDIHQDMYGVHHHPKSVLAHDYFDQHYVAGLTPSQSWDEDLRGSQPPISLMKSDTRKNVGHPETTIL